MKGMWLRVQGTCMTVTGTNSIAPGSPMPPLVFFLLCATAADGHSLLSRRDHHPWYLYIGRGWSAGLPPQCYQGSNGLEGKEAKGLWCIEF